VEKQKEFVHKVTLSSGKVVLLRDMKIAHQELAAEAVARKAGESALLMGTLMQTELLRLLIVQVDGRKPTATELLKLDEVFKYKEYTELMKVMRQIMGEDDASGGKGFLPQIEHVISGD
jgi:hypothetical protein